MSKRLLVFDLDKTLVKKSVTSSFFLHLITKGYYPSSCFVSALFYSLCHKYMTKDLYQLHSALFNNFLKDVELDAMDSLAEEYVENSIEELLYEPAFFRLKEANENGDYTMIFSATPDFLVLPIANHLKVTNYFATSYHIREGKFSGLKRVLDSKLKLQTLQKLQKQLEVAQDRIITFSDSYSDLCFLQASQSPIAVNPDKKLRLECERNHWEII